jgi:hypothetical protein
MARADHADDTELLALARGAGSQAGARHVEACAACQRRLREWATIRVGAGRAFPSQPPPTHVLDAALAQAGPAWGPGPSRRLAWTWQVLLAQAPIIRPGLWAASALMLVLGAAVALTSGRGPAGEVLTLVVPITAAMGVAWICGPEAEPAREVTAAIPVSPLLLLLSRLVLVTAFDLCVAGGASVVAAGWTLGDGLWAVVLEWLGPMLLLASLSLVVAVLSRPAVGVGVALTLWCMRILADSPLGAGSPGSPVPLLTPGQEELIRTIWTTDAVTLAGAALLFALALSQVPRRLRPS